MRRASIPFRWFAVTAFALFCPICAGQDKQTDDTTQAKAGAVTLHSEGLHGYIGFSHEKPPAHGAYRAGMGFYAAVWSLIEQPLADFQIGLPSSWITPDNSDNKDKPLAPEGTLAALDPALLVTPPQGLEAGYVPIVTHQAAR